MSRFVLVHGAWHGGWCWEPLTRELAARGHEVTAPDLPCDSVGLTQHDYARLLGDCSDAIAVGHSLGGLTISLVEARARVYLAAILPVENVYAVSFTAGFGGMERDELDRSYWPDAETAATRLYPDCDLETAAWAFRQLRPQARIAPHVATFGIRDVSIAMLRDAAVEPAWQLEAGRNHFGRVIELDAGHFPMLTHPAALAEVLESVE